MKVERLFKVLVCASIAMLALSCSGDDTPEPVDMRSFTTNSETDFFINHDGTVNLILTAAFMDDSQFGDVVSRGFVYGASSTPVVTATNTSPVGGANSNAATGYIENLQHGQSYFIRGYFEMADGSYFYGNEIQASTDVDASSTRSLSLEIEPDPFFKNQTEITPILKITDVVKEMPAEIGFEYSLNSDFSDSNTRTIEHYDGVHNRGVILQRSYASEVITGLMAGTKYYFRPYARYTDNTITNGGASTVTFTMSN